MRSAARGAPGTVGRMVTSGWLHRRGNAAAGHVRAQYPDLTVSVEVGGSPPHDRSVRLTWYDGPTRTDVERLLCRRYRTRRLAPTHLSLRRRHSLPVIIDQLLEPFPPGNLASLQRRLADRDLTGHTPTETAATIAALYTATRPSLTWEEMDRRYRDLRTFCSPDLAAAAAATGLPTD